MTPEKDRSFPSHVVLRTHTPTALASRIPSSTRDCNHCNHHRLVYRCYCYYRSLYCMHAIGRLPLSLQRSSCDRPYRFVARDGSACVTEPASLVVEWPGQLSLWTNEKFAIIQANLKIQSWINIVMFAFTFVIIKCLKRFNSCIPVIYLYLYLNDLIFTRLYY